MSTSPQEAAEAYAFRQLVAHMQMRTDVQNIELMILSGFCRNCLSKWYHAGLARAGVSSPYEDACQRVYGMSVADWKKSYQSKASEEQLRRMEETKALHAKHEKVDAHAAAARPPAPSEPPPTVPPSWSPSPGPVRAACSTSRLAGGCGGGRVYEVVRPCVVVRGTGRGRSTRVVPSIRKGGEGRSWPCDCGGGPTP